MMPLNFAFRVLTMRSAVERQAVMAETIANCRSLARSDWQFFYAVSHEQAGLSYDGMSALNAHGRTLSPAELSCFASHYSIIKGFLDEGEANYLLVCEDDIVIDPHFNFDDVFRMMHAADIEYLRLYSRSMVPADLIIYWARFQIFHFAWTPGGAQAYALSRAAATRLVNHIEARGQITRPIDDEMDRAAEIGNPVYALYPWPVLEHNAPTTIHLDDQLALRFEEERRLRAKAGRRGIGKKLASKVSALRTKAIRFKYFRGVRASHAELKTRLSKFFGSDQFQGFSHRND